MKVYLVALIDANGSIAELFGLFTDESKAYARAAKLSGFSMLNTTITVLRLEIDDTLD